LIAKWGAPSSRLRPHHKADEAEVIPILTAIIQNTPGYSEAYPAGVPRTFSWCVGTRGESRPPPTGFTAATAWAQIYPRAGAKTSPESTGRIEVAHAQTYVRMKTTRDWVRVQYQTRDKIEGDHFIRNYANNRAIPMTIDAQPDGTASMGLPPAGYNDHFWMAPRGTFPPNSIDGVYVQMQIRTTATNGQLVASIGADWWRNQKVGYVGGFANNLGAGVSNWVVLGKNWATLHFYSLSPLELRTKPPPPLAGYRIGLNFEPPSVSREPSPCLPVKPGDLRSAAGLDPQLPDGDRHDERNNHMIIKPASAKPSTDRRP
jgi:hypothetical protein